MVSEREGGAMRYDAVAQGLGDLYLFSYVRLAYRARKILKYNGTSNYSWTSHRTEFFRIIKNTGINLSQLLFRG